MPSSAIAYQRKKPGEWWRTRTYRHFDWPLPENKAKALALDPDRVKKHGFHPLLSIIVNTPRYKSDTHETEDKKRPIRYASHADSVIFAYYAHRLSEAYEHHLKATSHGNCVLAYRSLGKSNVDFACEAFDRVRAMGDCVALAMDVEKFFDTLDHKLLKRAWADMLLKADPGGNHLSEDEYAVFKHITHFSWVDRDDLSQHLTIDWRQAGRPLCTPVEFRAKVKNNGLIRNSRDFLGEDGKPFYWSKDGKRRVGIPQGTPISAVLANIYMDGFDAKLHAFVSSIGGAYYRYADDILLIIPLGDPMIQERAITTVRDELENIYLSVQVTKRERVEFHRVDTKDVIASPRPAMVKGVQGIKDRRALQYLGLEFDGKTIRLRSKSIARYYRRMKANVFMAKVAMRRHGKPANAFYRRRLYRTFTHLGHRSFYGYAKRAAQRSGSNAIKRQMRRHWDIMQQSISKPMTRKKRKNT